MSKSNLFVKAETPEQTELRGAKRDMIHGVTAMIRRSDGSLREGVVYDVSDRGVKISGDAIGLESGEMIDLLLVIQGEHVGYHGEIRHVDVPNRFYGILFKSAPRRGMTQPTKSCKQCRKDFPIEHNYCHQCGQRLVGGGGHGHAQSGQQRPVQHLPSAQ